MILRKLNLLAILGASKSYLARFLFAGLPVVGLLALQNAMPGKSVQITFLLMFPVVFVLARYFGSQTALVSILLSLVGDWFVSGPHDQGHLALYFVSAAVLAVWVDRDHRERERLRAREVLDIRRWEEIRRRHADERVIESEKKLRAVIEAVPIGFGIAEGNGRLTVFNKAAREIWGGSAPCRTVSEYSTYKGWQYETGEPLADVDWPLARAVILGESVREELIRIQCFDGSTKIIETHAVPFCNGVGKKIGGVVAFQDVTKKIEQERQLSENRERLETAVELVGLGFYDWNIVTDEVVFSDQMAKSWGFDLRAGSDQITLADALASIYGDDRERVVTAIQQTMYDRVPYHIKYRVQRPDGKIVWMDVSGRVIYDNKGSPVRFFGSCICIDEQMRAEEELKLATRLSEEANTAKGRFLANMSHEIRSPMNSILGYADLLKERGLSEADRFIYASRIKASGDHLLAIINDVLDLSKVEAGEFAIEKVPFSPVEIIADCVESVKVLANRKNLPILFNILTAIPRWIVSDPVRFRQILLNLLSNAVKFTESGSITLRLSYLGVESDANDARIVVEVEDSGIGISSEKSGVLFQPFSQLDSSVTRRFGGTGLGLFLSRRLAEALGGELRMRWSEPGRGSSFVFEIKARQVETSEFLPHSSPYRVAEACAPEAGARLSGVRVLLVDDSIDNQVLMKLYLTKLGATTIVAENGQEALEHASCDDIDVVLMDIMMPVMDGLEATRRLRSSGFTRPIIALTAHALREEVSKSLTAGCDHHLSKPVQFEEVASAINRFVARPASLLT